MIFVVPYLSQEGKPPSTRANGLDRLMEDLNLHNHQTSTPAPETIRRQVFQRIDEEPARVETDLKGRITSINPAFSGLCGYSFGEVKGRKPGSFLQGPETDANAVQILHEAVVTLGSADVTIINYHKDGSPYKVWISISPRKDENGNVIGFSAVEKKL